MKRREFIGLIGGAAMLPVAGRAQQRLPLIGFLRSTSGAVSRPFVASFWQGLKEVGFIEGQNVVAEYRYADNQYAQLPTLAAELIQLNPAVIAGNTTAALATKSATTTIPIVFGGGGDPIKEGLVASLNRPGGNITGVTFLAGQLAAKRLELLRQLVPQAAVIGMLVNPNTAETAAERKDVQAAAQTVGQQLVIADVIKDNEVGPAFESLVQRGAKALIVSSGGFMVSNSKEIAALAARYRLPASYSLREFAEVGGLMSYGTSITDAYRQIGIYAGRILKGERPADMPVMQSSKFEFVINLKTAKALGLEFHPQLLATADEVIE
jgi:putative ABC transport system substrate-binding protein